MAKSRVAAQPRRKSVSYGWLMLLAVLFGFGVSLWVRYMATPRLTALEQLIAANAPLDHVHTILPLPDGSLLVGAHTGLIGQTGRRWERLPGLEGDVMALQPAGDGGLYAAGDGMGVVHYQGGKTRTLYQGDVQALVTDPQNPLRILAYGKNGGLVESLDAGETWTRLASFDGQPLTALAVGPGGLLYAGSVQGTLYASANGGVAWDAVSNPGGSITFLRADADRLLLAAGGRALQSRDGGVSWQTLKTTEGRAWVALAPAKGGGLWGVTADGYLSTLTD